MSESIAERLNRYDSVALIWRDQAVTCPELLARVAADRERLRGGPAPPVDPAVVRAMSGEVAAAIGGDYSE